MPTRQELADALGFKSVNSIQQYLTILSKKGYIELEKNKRRGVVMEKESQRTVSVPLIGCVACGTPLLAEENIEAFVAIDERLVRDLKKYFFLTAQGDSMNQAGIDDGDLLLIESRSEASPGDTVLALIGDEATIKIYRPSAKYIALVPKSSNPSHKPIILTADFIIQGVVRTVIKQEEISP